jgi:hypothetical protein
MQLTITATSLRRNCTEYTIIAGFQSRRSMCLLRHAGLGQPLGALLVSDAMGNAGRNICPSVQPHDWRPCEASDAGVWRAVHQAAAWLDR